MNLRHELAEVLLLKKEVIAFYHERKADLVARIAKLNTDRQARVLELLKAQRLAICVMHRKIFPDSDVDTWIVPEEEVILARMEPTWVYHDYYTSGGTESCLSTCNICRPVIAGGISPSST